MQTGSDLGYEATTTGDLHGILNRQALDRTQPGLPLKKGRAGTMTHDYKRNGTTTLFAALDVAAGTVIGECLARHRADEFLSFLKTIDRETPAHLEIGRAHV